MNDYILGQPEPPRTRLGARFAVFGLVIVLVVGLLTTRLFYLQVVSGGYYAGLSQDAAEHDAAAGRGARPHLRPRRPARGDQRALVRRPGPARRSAVHRPRRGRHRLASLLNMSSSDIIQALDRNANQRYEYVNIATDVPEDVARLIDEESRDLPGVDVRRRGAPRIRVRPAAVARSRLHGLRHRRRSRAALRTRAT